MSRIHPTALVDPSAVLAEEVEVGPFAIIGAAVRLGRGTTVGGHATVLGPTEMGEENRIGSHAVIGSDPQDRKFKGERSRLQVGGRNVFREFVTVNRGTSTGRGVTTIGSGNAFLAGAHVAHDCEIEHGVTLDQKVLLAGHVRIEEGATLGGRCAVHQFVTIGRLAFVGGMSGISQDVPPYLIADGNPPTWIVGVNAKGLEKAGAGPDTIRALRESVRLLYKSDLIFAEAIAEILRTEGGHPEVQYLVQFLRNSGEGKHGRALEAFREHGPAETAGARKGA